MKDRFISCKPIIDEIKNIAYYLMTYSDSCMDPGLYYGRTGLAIFFFHLYKYTNVTIFEEAGFNHLNVVQSIIHEETPTDYDSGLAGIGAGIEYLCRHKLIGGDSNEILEHLDRKIFSVIKYKPYRNLSISKGMCGLGKYLLYRKISKDDHSIRIKKDIDTSILTILDLIEYKIRNELLKYEVDRLNPVWKDVLSFLKELSFYDPSIKLTGLLNIFRHYRIQNRRKINFPIFISKPQKKEYLGVYGGYAGRGLYLLKRLDVNVKNWSHIL